jgi:hypothetical protein
MNFCLFIQGERAAAQSEKVVNLRVFAKKKKKAYIEKEEKRWPFMNMLRPR